MSQNEDYLDSLLRSVTSYKREYNKKSEVERELLSRELEDLSDMSELDRQMDLIMDSSEKDDDEFLLEFEQELSEDQVFGKKQKEYKPETVAEHGKEELEFFDQLEKEIHPPKPEEMETMPEEAEIVPEEMETMPEETETMPEEAEIIPEEMETIPEEMETIPEEMETIPEEAETVLPEMTEANDTVFQEPAPELLTPELEELMEDTISPEEAGTEIPLPEDMVMPEIIGDGSMEDADQLEEPGLMDLLSSLSDEDEGLEEIEQLLKADEENISVKSVLNMPQEIEATLESEDGTVISKKEAGPLEENEPAENKKKKKKKKEKRKKDTDADSNGEPTGIKGLFAKIKSILGSDSDEIEEDTGNIMSGSTVAVPEEGSLESLSAENREILQELEEEEQEGKKGKRAKKEKAKKEKPKKEPKKKKESKPKPQKPPKPKKEKKPKEKLPPVPIPLLVVAIVLGGSISAFIYFFSGITGNEMMQGEAEIHFNKGEYTLAYESIEGMEITEQNEDLYNKIRLMAYLSQERDSFYYFQQIGEYECALDALVRGVMRYETYVDEAASYGLEEQYQTIEEEIELRLADTFLLSADNAMELIAISDREEYTKQVYGIVEQLGFNSEEGVASAQEPAQ